MNQYNTPAAELLIRTFTGILFFFQGYDKLFKIKMHGVIETFVADADKCHIPRRVLTIVAYYTSVVEFAGGILLLAGFCTSYALYALGLDLLLVSFAFTYMEPMWNMKHVLPRLVLIAFLLIMPPDYRLFSVDHFIKLR